MNTLQKKTIDKKPNYLNTNGSRKDKSDLKIKEGKYPDDETFRDFETKKKINRFFAGLPFNPEP